MKTRKWIITKNRIVAEVFVFIPLLAVLAALLSSTAAVATTYEVTELSCGDLSFRAGEVGGNEVVLCGFSCSLDTSNKNYPDSTANLWTYRAGTGWVESGGPPPALSEDGFLTWVVLKSEAVETTRKDAVDDILEELQFRDDNGTPVEDPVLAWKWKWAEPPADPGEDVEYWVVVVGKDCWCSPCAGDAVADCGKPYVEFHAGPVTFTHHTGTGWGYSTTEPPNSFGGACTALDIPQLNITTSGSVTTYDFRHGAMRTRAMTGIPDLPGNKGILHANGTALLWTHNTVDNEYVFTSKTRARIFFDDSSNNLDRIVAANGIDKLRYKWSGSVLDGIYTNKVNGKRRKTVLNYNGNNHIESINENVVSVTGTWPDESETLLWSRTTTISYTGSGAGERMSTITHPGSLTTTFAYDGSNRLEGITYPFGHRRHWVYSGDKVDEYYEDGSTLKNFRRAYAYDQEGDYDEDAPWNLFSTQLTWKGTSGNTLGRTLRYHDGWMNRNIGSATFRYNSGTQDFARLHASVKSTASTHGSGRTIAGGTFGSGIDNFFHEIVVSRTEHGSPRKFYGKVFASSSGNADSSESNLRLTIDYITPDADVPHFEAMTKTTTQVGRETNAAYYTDPGDDDSYKYNLKEVYLNSDSGNKTTYEYYGDSDGDDAGLPKKITGFDGKKVEYDYSERRIEKVYITSSDDTKKQVLEYTYNDGANGNIPYDAITKITDLNGKEATFTYDSAARITSIVISAGPSSQTWQYAYAPNASHHDAKQITVTRPDSKQVVYQYNPDGALAWVDAPDVGGSDMKTEFDYDNLGRLIRLTDPDDNETEWEYDFAGRVVKETIEGDGAATNVTEYGYNPDGQIAHIEDALGQTFEYDYNDDNWLSSITMTDAAQAETTKSILYSWNTDDKTMLWTMSVGGDVVEMKYNEYGLLDYVDGVLSGDDANADLVRYGYDADYRLTELGYYIYNTGTSDYVLWSTTYDYDTFGRLETIEDRLGLTSTYAYNNDFTLKSLTLPSGTVTSYTYDDLRRLVSMATTGLNPSDIIVKFTYEYNDLGLRDKVTMHDGRTTEWAYDDVGRLVEEHFKSGGPSPTTLLRYLYEYDAAGNRTSKKTDYDDDPGAYAATTTYTNNGYNQLTGVSGTRGDRVNVTGTIPTAWTLTGGDVTVTPNSTPGDAVDAEVRGRFFIARNVELDDSDSNQLVASTSATTLAGNSPSSDTVLSVALESDVLWSYSYSANGDLALMEDTVHNSAVLWSYTYSVDGWLTKAVKIVDGETELTEEYFYDPVGRKYKTSVTEDQTTTTRYFVEDTGAVLLELKLDSGDYTLEKEYIRGSLNGGGIGGLLYTRDADGSVGYCHYDGQGNVVSITNEACEEVAYYEYDAWGNVLTECGALADEFKFSTKQASAGTGLIDFGYRWYDPKIGRWTQRDLVTSASLYPYCGNSPVSHNDPTGADYYPNDDANDILDSGLTDLASELEWGGMLTPHSPEDMAGAMNAIANVTTLGIYGLIDASVCVGKEHGAGAGIAYGVGKIFGVTDVLEGAYGVDLASGQMLSGSQRAFYIVSGGVKGYYSIRGFTAKSDDYYFGNAGRNRGCRGVGPCFVAGTEVATETGAVPIEEIEVGDSVWACDPETGTLALAEVTRVFVRTSDHLLVVTVGDEAIETTAEHPFWVVGDGWTAAGELEPGDLVRTLDGGALSVTNIEHRDGAVTVYNLEVAGQHTYFVSGNQVLVHNACSAPRNAGGTRGFIPESAQGKSWTTQRRHYWKANIDGLSPGNKCRIMRGRSPIGADGNSMHLHHGSATDPWSVTEMTRSGHVKLHQRQGWRR